MKRRHFLGLIVDGAGVLGAEAGVDPHMFKREIVESQESELVDSESELPREVCRSEVLGRCVRYRNEGHVCREFM